MSFRQTFNKLKGEFDKVMDMIDPPRQSHPQPPPPVPFFSRPGQPAPAVPHGSRPGQDYDPPPPPYYPNEQNANPVYWNPEFLANVPVSAHFDFDLGAGGWGNNELQTYTSFPSNSFHTNERTLVVRANINSKAAADREKYTSARLLSKQRLGYQRGYVSAVMAAPCASGIWPAFWLLPQEPFSWPVDGEVDIFESWNGDRVNHSCLHWGHYTTREEKQKHRVISTKVATMDMPHEYGVAWEQPDWGQEGGRLVWYIDGRAVLKGTKPPGTRRFEEWRILLNIAVGGNVCQGRIPSDGTYDMTLHRVSMSHEPPGGWAQFENDWRSATGGRPIE